MDFEKLLKRELPAPWVPQLKDDFDSSNFDPYDEDEYVIEPYQDDGSNWYADF